MCSSRFCRKKKSEKSQRKKFQQALLLFKTLGRGGGMLSIERCKFSFSPGWSSSGRAARPPWWYSHLAFWKDFWKKTEDFLVRRKFASLVLSWPILFRSRSSPTRIRSSCCPSPHLQQNLKIKIKNVKDDWEAGAWQARLKLQICDFLSGYPEKLLSWGNPEMWPE